MVCVPFASGVHCVLLVVSCERVACVLCTLCALRCVCCVYGRCCEFRRLCVVCVVCQQWCPQYALSIVCCVSFGVLFVCDVCGVGYLSCDCVVCCVR